MLETAQVELRSGRVSSPWRKVRVASQRDTVAADLRRVTTELDDLRVATEVKSRGDRSEVGRCRLTRFDPGLTVPGFSA